MNRRQIGTSIGALLIVAGITVVLVVQCVSKREGPKIEEVAFMGYSNGEEAYNGLCKHKTSAAACFACCTQATQGMPPEQQGICLDLCLKQWGGAKSEQAIADAGALIESGDHTDVVKMGQARMLLKKARFSTAFPRVAAMAAVLCAQFKLT
jgi:hypothetical protein